MAKKNKKSTQIEISMWWNERDESIHIGMPGKRITTVNRKSDSVRCHEHLFNRLAQCLREAGRPAP